MCILNCKRVPNIWAHIINYKYCKFVINIYIIVVVIVFILCSVSFYCVCSFVCCVSFERGVILCDMCYLFVVSYCTTTATE
jgi:hypothetical protein